jgi:integrase
VELYRKKDSQFWRFDFKVRGKRYRGSTKETNIKRAEKVAALKLSQAIEGTDPLDRKAPSLQQFSTRFLTWVESSKLEQQTKRYYRDGWRLLSTTKILGARLDRISKDDAETLNFNGLAANTNFALRALRRMLHKAEEWNLITKVPKLKLLKEHGRRLRLDEDVEQKLIAATKSLGWRRRSFDLFRDVVILARDTGMRNGRELYRMRIENVDWKNRTIFVPDSKTPDGRKVVPMSDRVYELLRRNRVGNKREGWVFASKRAKCGHLTDMAHQFRLSREKAGLPDDMVLYCGRHD